MWAHPARSRRFPSLVLAEVAAEMRSQHGAYTILRESARAAAPGSGLGANIAADHLGDDFDSQAALAVQTGLVIVDMPPEEVALGVLPILACALYVWFRGHRPAAHPPPTWPWRHKRPTCPPLACSAPTKA